MSRDRKEFSERLKHFFKEGGVKTVRPPSILLTEELCQKLNKHSPNHMRLKAIEELLEHLATHSLEENGDARLWTELKDSLSLFSPDDIRRTVIKLFTLLASRDQPQGLMPKMYFKYIQDNYIQEDTELMFDFFEAVVWCGKKIEYIEHEVAPFFLNWVPLVFNTSKTKNALDLITNLVKFNSAYLDEHDTAGFISLTTNQFTAAKDEEEAEKCLHVIECVIAYSIVPHRVLSNITITLTRAGAIKDLSHLALKIMRNILGTHRGIAVMNQLEKLSCNTYDQRIMASAVFFMTVAICGPREISALQSKIMDVLPCLLKASETDNFAVVHEVALGIQRLLICNAVKLYPERWKFIFDIVGNISQHTMDLEDGSTQKNAIVSHLHDIVNTIEKKIKEKPYFGCVERFNSLLETYSLLQKEDKIIGMLNEKRQCIEFIGDDWLKKLCAILRKYFKNDARPKVKIAALEILEYVYNMNRSTHEKGMMIKKVSSFFGDIDQEGNTDVKTKVIEIVLRMALSVKGKIVLKLIDVFDKIVLAPYTRIISTNLVREGEAYGIDRAVDALITIFKSKLFEIQPTVALMVYRTLITCLEYHYDDPNVLNTTSSIRYQILDLIFELKVNNCYKLGLARKYHQSFPGVELLPSFQYTSYLILKNTDNFRIKTVDKQMYQEEVKILTYSPTKMDRKKIKKDTSSESISLEFELGRDMEELTLDESEDEESNEDLHLDLTSTAVEVIRALKTETDWTVMSRILSGLPHAIVNKIFLLTKDGHELDELSSSLCDLVTDQCLMFSRHTYTAPGKFKLSNAPENFRWSEFQSHVYPVLACLASHHMYLSPEVQMKIVQSIQRGVINRVAGHVCLSSMTLCVVEMKVMVKQLHNVIEFFSTISPTKRIARPMLEFLSCVLHFPDLYANFILDHYMAIFAIAAAYTNPLKFNHYIVTLAYHVLTLWFIKCRPICRVPLVKYISKKLNNIIDDVTKVLKPNLDSQDEETKKAAEEKLQFYKDLLAAFVDLMSLYAYSGFETNSKRDKVVKMLLAEGDKLSWIMGNKIITITTSGCSRKTRENQVCDKCLEKCGIIIDKELSAVTANLETTEKSTSEDVSSSNTGSSQDSSKTLTPISPLSPVSPYAASSPLFENQPSPSRTSTPSIKERIKTIVSELSTLRATSSTSFFATTAGFFATSGATGTEKSSRFSAMSDLPTRSRGSDINPQIEHKEPPKTLKLTSVTTPSPNNTEKAAAVLSKDDLLPLSSAADSGNTPSPQKGVEDVNSPEDQTEESEMNIMENCWYICPCWCKNWAEISIKQPSGTVAWTMRLQNPMLPDSQEGFPLDELSDLYSTPFVPEQQEHRLLNQVFTDDGGKSERQRLAESLSGECSRLQSPLPIRRERGHTIADMNPATRRPNPDCEPLLKPDERIVSNGLNSALPRFIFLQMYYSMQLGTSKNMPMMLPENNHEILRTVGLIDYIVPQETHKIGVLYVAPGETTEQQILANTHGSLRYHQFIMGLGEIRELCELSEEEEFLGGLSTYGIDGKQVYIWHDEIIKVVFHIATLMPTKESDPKCNGKKRHIGNNFTTIVYNESGKPYNLNTLKTQFNHSVIEVQPGYHQTNTVSILCKPLMAEFMADEPTRLVSDESLPVLVRQLALHANLASMVKAAQRSRQGLYANNWVERLRMIRKIRLFLENEFKTVERELGPSATSEFTNTVESVVELRESIDNPCTNLLKTKKSR